MFEKQDEPALAMAPRLLSFSLVSFLILLLLPSLCISLSPDRSLHPRLLVLIDDFALKSSHSIFFNSLLGSLLLPGFFLKLFSLFSLIFVLFCPADRGYELDFKLSSDPSLALKKYGEYLFDGLVVFSPAEESK